MNDSIKECQIDSKENLFKRKSAKIFYVCLIVLAVIISFLGFIPVDDNCYFYESGRGYFYESGREGKYKAGYYADNLFDVIIMLGNSSGYLKEGQTEEELEKILIDRAKENATLGVEAFIPLIISISTLASIFILIALFCWYLDRYCKNTHVELQSNGMGGSIKRLFSTASLNVPIEKIDSVFIKKSLVDKICSGETVVIRSGASLTKVMCVQNAAEFVDLVLLQIRNYKESLNNKISSANDNDTAQNDDIEKLKKLKALADDGVITQEEYESKRKSLIDKI